MDFRFCKKCLTRDIMEKVPYFETLRELIQNIPEDMKVPNDLYEERLACCKACERLIDGLCGACGCYVELRAAKTNEACPYSKWGKFSN